MALTLTGIAGRVAAQRAGNVRGNGSAATPYLANARTQDTVLLGATAWF